MLNYFTADTFRILRSRSFWIMSLIAVVIYAAGVFMISGPGYSVDTHAMITMMAGTFATILGGIGMYNAVYSQDIKAGAMRVAIGRGTARFRIVLVKFLDMVVVAVLGGVVFYAIVRFLPLAFGIGASDRLSSVALTTTLQVVLQVILYAALAAIVSFARQESVTATVIFVLLSAGIIDQFLGLLLSQEIVTNIIGDITAYLPQGLANTLGAQLGGMSGGVSLTAALVYVGYIVVSLACAGWVFRKKELEF